MASLLSSRLEDGPDPVRRVLEKEADHRSHYVRVALILQLPQAGQNRLIKKIVEIRFFWFSYSGHSLRGMFVFGCPISFIWRMLFRLNLKGPDYK
ncbi:MAG: hypothetical protein ACP5PV_06735 [Methanothrix sp.]